MSRPGDPIAGWIDGDSELEDRLAVVADLIVAKRPDKALVEVQEALRTFPSDPTLLLLGALSALLAEKPDSSLRYQKRFTKTYAPMAEEIHLLRAIALAQQEHWYQAKQVLDQREIGHGYLGTLYLPCNYAVNPWLRRWVARIERENKRIAAERARPKATQPKPRASKAPAKSRPSREAPEPAPAGQPGPDIPRLPAYGAEITTSFSLPASADLFALAGSADDGPEWFRLRHDYARLGLLEEYDDLLCLPSLRGVEPLWYQIETARKVLKQFRGRVLLADEVGLGKTIEAGMVLKEYILRGMVERVLVLTPASLVGQWVEEMATKFDLRFASSYDGLLRSDPEAFWAQPRVIASIAAARRTGHVEILARQTYDLVVVDEAHHLKNRATSNWKLVDALRKRFLLLLSATPVENNLVELYNLLTLLKPGIFKTEKEFRSSYMTAGKPRLPANRDRMRDLMRDVMIRNTRSLVEVRLPPRHAVTLRVEPEPEEAACYVELSRLAQSMHTSEPGRHRLALRTLLSTAGSSPAAAAVALSRFAETNDLGGEWQEIARRYTALPRSGKEAALSDLLSRNPHEKTMVFVHHRATLERLGRLLETNGVPYARFEGAMSGPEKDRAVERFRDEVPVLLCTESGGEGRNLQFANTLVNFDLPWNPMQIEQRIGRLHRIGQTREVFVFNIAVRGTIEEYVLRILDEKINMFELVVGEIGAILGEMDDSQEFAERVFAAWVEASEEGRATAFEALGDEIVEARRQYDGVKALDEQLFGDEFATE